MSIDQQVDSLSHVTPVSDGFYAAVIEGLSRPSKRLPCKYFYDKHGSDLFDRICELDEYYLTRTELEIMRNHAAEMAQRIVRDAMLIEYGSGSSIKTRLLIDHLRDLAVYCPVDISREHLFGTAEQLAADYPQLRILPVCADFTQPFDLSQPEPEPAKVTVYFPGSTIGNFEPPNVISILRQIAVVCGRGGELLIGIDLQKDVSIIEAAYNDKDGVTDEFNLNLLTRINRELNADFDVDAFRHRARYDEQHHRVELGLVSQRRQTVTVGNHKFEFQASESIHTEYSHKYSVEGFAALASKSGFQLVQHWTDKDALFGVLLLETRSND